MLKTRVTKDEIDTMIKLYNSGMGTYAIGNIMDRHPTTIWANLCKNNVKMRKVGHADGGNRKIFFDIEFFDVIDTEAKAYFLGFLFADGCVCSNRHRISVSLHPIDIEILHKFAENIDYPKNKVWIRKHFRKDMNHMYETCGISLNSKHIYNSLIKHGCVPRKSKILKFPITISNNLLNHFIRGYFDGDGSIGIRYKKCGGNYSSITIQGNFEFLTKLGEVLENIFLLPKTYIYYGNGCFTLAYFGNKKNLEFKDFLYKDATIYLKRKYDRFMKIV